MKEKHVGKMVLAVLFFVFLSFGLSWGQNPPVLLVVVRALDDTLWKMTCDEVACSPFSSFPGLFRYQPTVTWDEGAQEWVIVGTASDNTIWMATFNKNGSFNNDWQSLPGLTPSPAGASGSFYGVLGKLSCTSGQVAKWNGNVWDCANDEGGGVGDITSVIAGTGLTGGGTSGDVTLSANFAGSGSATTVARSDHNHDATYVNEGQAGSITSAMIVDGTISFSDIGQNGCGTNQIMKWSGSVWVCAADENSGGDITSVIAGTGLTGGGTSEDVTLNVSVPLSLSGSAANAGIVSGFNSDANGRGVHGSASNTGAGLNIGGYFSAAGTSGLGVYGVADNAGSATNYGGYFVALGTYGRGVYGWASNTGIGRNYGGYFVASSNNGYGVYGETPGNYGAGVVGKATGTYGAGVWGTVSSTYGLGVRGQASGTNGAGVWGESTSDTTGVGVYGYAPGTNGIGVGSHAVGTSGVGVYGYATGTSGHGVRGYGGEYDFLATGPGIDYGVESSIRWKRNIQEIDGALDKIMSLRGVYFDWDEEHGGKHDIGFIAEEVGKVIPEIVAFEPDGVYATGIDYGAITPMLVQAIKEQQKQIEELKAQINELRKR
ncbi:MAG: tail fiber domain-containing protein [Syntrophaceae bacterium]|nr:tail fiber domain-containing protein [Syntrophaceae bacterium]